MSEHIEQAFESGAVLTSNGWATPEYVQHCGLCNKQLRCDHNAEANMTLSDGAVRAEALVSAIKLMHGDEHYVEFAECEHGACMAANGKVKDGW